MLTKELCVMTRKKIILLHARRGGQSIKHYSSKRKKFKKGHCEGDKGIIIRLFLFKNHGRDYPHHDSN